MCEQVLKLDINNYFTCAVKILTSLEVRTRGTDILEPIPQLPVFQ